MKGFGRKLSALAISIILACALAGTASAASVENCPGECAHQAAVGTVHYDTLQEAAAAAVEGSTVTLLADVTTSTSLTLDRSIALDLGGKTLTAALTAPEQAAVCFTKGGTVRNGKITASAGSALTVSGCTVAIEKDAVLEGSGTAPTLRLTAAREQTAKVNLSGEISGKGPAAVIDAASAEGSCELYVLKGAKLTAEENAAITFDCAGKLDISNGTIQTKKDAIFVTVKEKRKTELSVTGGKLLCQEGEAFVITTQEKAEAPKDFVTGGTYQKVPNAYVPSYCKLRDNQDGTYTVISSYTLTYQSGGGSGTMEAVKVRCGSAVKLPKNGFTAPKGMDFVGWDIGGKTCKPGDEFTPEGDVTITALWKTHEHSGGKATCLKKAKCESCGKSYGQLGSHKLSYTGGYAATCTDGGMNAHNECSVCGECYVDGAEVSADSLSTPALGHSWQTVDGTPATCTDDGVKTHDQCADCGALRIGGETVTAEELPIPAAGHAMEAVDAAQATCTDPGIQAHEHCTVCDQQFLKGEVVEEAQLTTATSSHVLSDWQSDEYYHWKTCVDCGEVFRQSGHSDADADDACDDCGYAIPIVETEADDTGSGFSWLFLIPVIAAVAIAVPLAIKKRK